MPVPITVGFYGMVSVNGIMASGGHMLKVGTVWILIMLTEASVAY